jgi:hypothetical protein
MVTTSRLRADFIWRAAERVENMIAYQADEIGTAVEELRRYFEWVKDSICPEERLQIKPLAGRLNLSFLGDARNGVFRNGKSVKYGD